VEQTTVTIQTEGFSDVRDLSDRVDSFLSDVGGDGLFNACVPGSTAVVTTIEFESGCVEDLQQALEEIAPSDRTYKHNEKWGDGNGFSHLRASLMGPDVTMPFKNGSLQNGTWQQVVLVDHDNRSRDREVMFTALKG
jgi:secondary thiamine-phosphate synthase enzyme